MPIAPTIVIAIGGTIVDVRSKVPMVLGPLVPLMPPVIAVVVSGEGSGRKQNC
jgi:hypothetical protein